MSSSPFWDCDKPTYTYDDEEPETIEHVPSDWNNHTTSSTKAQLVTYLVRKGSTRWLANQEMDKEFEARAPRHQAGVSAPIPSVYEYNHGHESTNTDSGPRGRRAQSPPRRARSPPPRNAPPPGPRPQPSTKPPPQSRGRPQQRSTTNATVNLTIKEIWAFALADQGIDWEYATELAETWYQGLQKSGGRKLPSRPRDILINFYMEQGNSTMAAERIVEQEERRHGIGDSSQSRQPGYYSQAYATQPTANAFEEDIRNLDEEKLFKRAWAHSARTYGTRDRSEAEVSAALWWKALGGYTFSSEYFDGMDPREYLIQGLLDVGGFERWEAELKVDQMEALRRLQTSTAGDSSRSRFPRSSQSFQSRARSPSRRESSRSSRRDYPAASRTSFTPSARAPSSGTDPAEDRDDETLYKQVWTDVLRSRGFESDDSELLAAYWWRILGTDEFPVGKNNDLDAREYIIQALVSMGSSRAMAEIRFEATELRQRMRAWRTRREGRSPSPRVRSPSPPRHFSRHGQRPLHRTRGADPQRSYSDMRSSWGLPFIPGYSDDQYSESGY